MHFCVVVRRDTLPRRRASERAIVNGLGRAARGTARQILLALALLIGAEAVAHGQDLREAYALYAARG
jgi:hypothetical protein